MVIFVSVILLLRLSFSSTSFASTVSLLWLEVVVCVDLSSVRVPFVIVEGIVAMVISVVWIFLVGSPRRKLRIISVSKCIPYGFPCVGIERLA